jgi:hypothetical protein
MGGHPRPEHGYIGPRNRFEGGVRMGVGGAELRSMPGRRSTESGLRSPRALALYKNRRLRRANRSAIRRWHNNCPSAAVHEVVSVGAQFAGLLVAGGGISAFQCKCGISVWSFDLVHLYTSGQERQPNSNTKSHKASPFAANADSI